MTLSAIAFSLFLAAGAQATGDVETLFESGRYPDALAAGSASDDPAVVYVAAQAAQKAGQGDQANSLFERLAGRGEGDAWRFVGQSALALSRGNLDEALAAANQAVAANAGLPQAHYQLGLVQGHRQDFAAAAPAFAKAAELAPTFAYAHYNAGLSYYRVKRIDLMATHFEAFLREAPEAPERGEVESIMRTVRGR